MAVSKGARRAWLIAGSVLTVAMLVSGTAQAVSALAHEEHTVTRVFPGSVHAIEVGNDAGALHIIGSSRRTIEVVAHVSRGLMTPTYSETVSGTTLEVGASCSGVLTTWCNLDYTIFVPSNTKITAGSSGGSVSVSGVTGALDLSSSGGGVHGTDLASTRVHASSSGGTVRLTFADAPSSVDASSSGGGVHIIVPDDAIPYRVDASSSGGGTHVNVRTDPHATRTISAHSSGGSVSVDYPTSAG